jgi:hypothetical protein
LLDIQNSPDPSANYAIACLRLELDHTVHTKPQTGKTNVKAKVDEAVNPSRIKLIGRKKWAKALRTSSLLDTKVHWDSTLGVKLFSCGPRPVEERKRLWRLDPRGEMTKRRCLACRNCRTGESVLLIAAKAR